MTSLTEDLMRMSDSPYGRYKMQTTDFMKSGYDNVVNPVVTDNLSMKAGFNKATNSGQMFPHSQTSGGNAALGMGLMNAGKQMQSAMSSQFQPFAESKFTANRWNDISDVQPTGQAGASMNLYIQKMLSNPAIMQLLQSRMGASNG